MALSKMESDRLAKVLALIDSDRDGEALSALHKARILLSRSGLAMKDLLDPRHLEAPDSSPYGGGYAERPTVGLGAAQEIQHLQTEIEGLRSALQNRDAEVASLNKFRDESFTVLENKNDKIIALKRDLHELRKKCLEMGNDLPAEINQLRRDLADALNKAETVDEDRERALDKLSRRDSEIASLKIRLEKWESRPPSSINDETAGETETRAAIARLDAEAAGLRRFRDEALLALSQRSEQVDDLRRRITNLQKAIAVLRGSEPTQTEDLRTSLDRAESTLEHTQTSLHRAQEGLHRHARETEDLRQRVNTLRLAIKDDAENDKIMERRLREAVLRLDSEAEALRHQRDDLTALLSAAPRMQSPEEETRPESTPSGKSQSKITDLEAKAADALAELATREAKLAQVEADLADLRAAAADRRRKDIAKAAQAQAEAAHVKTLLAAKVKETTAAIEAQDSLRIDVERLKKETAEIHNLRALLAARRKNAGTDKQSQAKIEQLESQLSEQAKTEAELESRVEVLTSQLADLERDLTATREDNEALKAELDAMEQAAESVSISGQQEATIRAELEMEILQKVGAESGQGGSFLDKALQVLSEKNDEIVRLKGDLEQYESGGRPAAPVAPTRAGSTAAPQTAPAVPRTNAEKRAAVLEYLKDPERSELSDREIARQVGVSPQTVSNWRKRLSEEES
ncbi:helix-turn-helix domain-containing protein [Magnetospira sp. QH-2]|uniref:helix-turn-helix domain-containing protein n=1 Tax=Magnetospira sp. (strain QH-2) TaxID=1288970 RepID=UPI0003E80A3F|nr:helix-turn-helix domain-containing protein [Magnetospira sp. QH-2]CCQ73878.1 Protein of unknown function. coiled-coil [Magnetospira sp. QH-2]